MRRLFLSLLFLSFFIFSCIKSTKSSEKKICLTKINDKPLTYLLPSPDIKGAITLEATLLNRRSRRSYLKNAISAEDISQILWAAYGITKPLPQYPQVRGKLRTAPSAGGLYPLELYVLVENVKNVEPGVYKYNPQEHKIIRTIDKNIKKDLAIAALNQDMIEVAPACLFYSAVYGRNTDKYGSRGRERYVCMDLGHSAQNVYLQAEALHLGTCAIGAFNDDKVKVLMQLTEEEEPLYIMPIGKYNKRE